MSKDQSKSSDILVIYDHDPLNGMSRDAYIDLLKQRLKGRVEKAYFFGSFTGPYFNKESDIDIILIKNTDVPFIRRALEFEDVLDIVPDTDILVYTTDEFEGLTSHPTTGFWRSVTGSMVRFI